MLLLAPLLLTLNRAVMIDDALFLKVAAQIVRDPWRPFGVTVNWYGWEEPLWGVFKNPPGLAYWLAGIGIVGGPREVVWHLSLLPFSIAAVVAGVRLARRFTAAPAWVTAAWVACPAFLVSAATLMADVPSLALALWGLVLWIDGTDHDSRRTRLLGALLTGAGVIVKYTTVLAVAVLVLYTVSRTVPRRWRTYVGDLWPALVPVAAWAVATLATDGRIHVIDSLLVRGGGIDPNPGWFGHRAVSLLTFVAGAGVFPLLFVVTLWRTTVARLLVVLGAVIGVVAAVMTPMMWSPRGLLPGAVPLVGLLAAVGAWALLAGVRSAWLAASAGDRDTLFLVTWIALHVAFLWLWSWTVAARFVLPMLVPLALLLGRVLEPQVARVSRTGWLAGATAAALVLSVAASQGDRVSGDFHRRVIADLSAQAQREHRPILFTGAWGFQYYAERAGMVRLDVRTPRVASGDLILQPYFVANNELPAALTGQLMQVASIPGPAPTFDLHTMNLHAGAGFYSSVYGPLPFFRAHLPADGVMAWIVRAP